MPTQTVRVPTGDGDLKASLALPDSSAQSDSPRPGVIVLHELFGLNNDIRRIAQRFADNGYVALAPDLYSVGPRRRLLCIRRTMQALRSGEGRAFDDIESARAWLAKRDDVDERSWSETRSWTRRWPDCLKRCWMTSRTRYTYSSAIG